MFEIDTKEPLDLQIEDATTLHYREGRLHSATFDLPSWDMPRRLAYLGIFLDDPDFINSPKHTVSDTNNTSRTVTFVY